MTYNTSYDAIQAIYRPPNINTNITAPSFTITCAFTSQIQYLIYLNRSKVTYEDEIDAENQKLFKSLADKWYISLIIYLMKQFKPNIDL